MDENKILQAEHDLISDVYDWLNCTAEDTKSKIHYVLGAHDLAMMLLAQLDEAKGR